MKRLLIFVMVLSLFACEEKQQIPEGIWNQEEFAKVLSKFQLAEAIVRLGYHREVDSTFANDSIYNSAFREAGVTKEQFKTNMEYYLERPEELSKVYDLTLEILSEESAHLKEKKSQEFTIVE